MKPRNKKERMFAELAALLPPVSDRCREWAFRHCFKPVASFKRRGRKVKCLHCGAESVWDKPFFESFLDVDEFDCPECGRSMPMEENAAMTELKLFSVITTFRGHQVIRTFDVGRYNAKGVKTDYTFDEVYQNWITEDGTEVITGKPFHRSPFTMGWDHNGGIDIKRHNGGGSGYYQMDDIYNITGNFMYPIARVSPLLRRNGWRKSLLRFSSVVSMSDAMMKLLKCPTAEMLIKTGQTDLFIHMIRENLQEIDYLHSVRIANRRGYKVTDAGMWIDMLNMARRLGLDTHNPSVVCPPDLREAHDRMLARVAKIDLATDRETAIASEKGYRRDKGRYFGILIDDDPDITLKVITSVEEVLEEADAMHHCVFANKYYEKPHSLLLSARDKKGERLETVELSLRSFKVLQSRGRHNQLTDAHDRIIDLVEKNKSVFQKCKRQI
ncbi:MAG: PcfJ domain-containing protein [Muribaculaceae bacterium]|nr:PcfJ domain-containing protein [Muribaculaceae bacterium]